MDAIRSQNPSDPRGAETVLVLHEQPQRLIDQLASRFPELRFVAVDRYADVARVVAETRPRVALTYKISGQGAFPGAALLQGGGLGWVHVGGAGIDHLGAWDPAEVVVTNSSGIHGRPLAMLVTWAIFNQALRMPLFAAQQQARQWLPHELDLPPRQVVVIVGFGRIGREIGRGLRAFDFHVLGVRRDPAPAPEADEVIGMGQLREALGRADYVVLVTPLTAQTRGLFDAGMLGAMKHGAHLINIARGGIVDEQALCEKLASGAIGSATLDVFETEPLPVESPLWHAPNTVITPHGISDTQGWEGDVLGIFMENLEHWRAGWGMRNLCDPKRGY